jgi:hypothetical protein
MATESMRSTKPGDARYKPKVIASPTTRTSLKADELDMSTAFVDKSNQTEKTKTTGIKTRGNGAATRGVTARGPMA